MGRCDQLERLRRLWPVGPELAALSPIPSPRFEYLKRHYKLAILSNVDNESFSFSNEKLGVDFDASTPPRIAARTSPPAAISITCSPSSRRSGLRRVEILHTAESLFHDHGPANEHGLASCWIHRRHGQEGSGATMALAQAPQYDFRFDSLADFVKAHQEALKA